MRKFQLTFIFGIALMLTACSSKEKATVQTVTTQQVATGSDITTVGTPAAAADAAIEEKSFELSTESKAYYLSPTDREAFEKNTKQLKNVPKIIKPWIMRGAKPYLLIGDANASSGYTIRYLSSKDYDDTIAFLQKNILAESVQDASLISEVSGAGLSTWSYAGFLSDGNVLHLLISNQQGEDVNVYIIVDPPQ